MLYGFQTSDEVKARAALVIYAVYRSRNKARGPSGLDMWGQIERYARSAAKRATGIDEFVSAFKRKMACSSINPYWLKGSGTMFNAVVNEDGSMMTTNTETQRNFGLDIFEADGAGTDAVVEAIYDKTQIIILLVRDRLEREKPFEALNEQEADDET